MPQEDPHLYSSCCYPEIIIPTKPIIQESNESGGIADTIRSEIERLQKKIISRDAKITALEKELSDVNREKDKYENGYYNYLIELDKVREALETIVPAHLVISYQKLG